jgi:hypothetical protein
MSKQKEDLERMLGALHSDESKKELISRQAHTKCDDETCEYLVEQLIGYEMTVPAAWLLDQLDPEKARGLHAELSEQFEKMDDYDSAAKHADLAGQKERAEVIYRELSEEHKESNPLKSARYAVKAGDPVGALRSYAAWIEGNLDWAKNVYEDDPKYNRRSAETAEDFMEDLERDGFIPEGMKKVIKDKVSPLIVKKYVASKDFDSAHRIADRYGQMELLFTELEHRKLYLSAQKIAEKAGLEELAEVYKKL